nr:hypothetical protein [Acinetobacter sp. Marseille-Q1620]
MIIFTGSSVTGRSSAFSKTPNSPFDYGRLSDFDIALVNDDLYINALELGRANGFKVKTLPDRIGPLNDKQAEYIDIKDLRKQLEYQVGRLLNLCYMIMFKGYCYVETLIL